MNTMLNRIVLRNEGFTSKIRNNLFEEIGFKQMCNFLEKFIIKNLYLLAFIIFSQNLNAAEISIVKHKRGDSYNLILEGEIKKGDLDKITDLSKNKLVTSIQLFSPGGNVQEGFRIAEYLNENLIAASAPSYYKIDTTILNSCREVNGPKDQNNCTCASSCAFIWMIAPIRYGNIVKVHRPRFDYNDFSNMSLAEAKQNYEKLMINVKNILIDAQINPQIIDLVMNTSSGSIRALNENELDSIGIYAPYIDELLQANCKNYIDELANYNFVREETRSLNRTIEDKCSIEPAASTKYCEDIIRKWIDLEHEKHRLEPKNYNKCARASLDRMRQKSQFK